jgi:DNA processing protein
MMHHVILHLSLIDDIGPVTIATIVQHKPTEILWEDLYKLSASDIQHYFGLSASSAQKIVIGLQDKTLLEKELLFIHQHTISWITILDDQYPALLKNSYAPPAVLYWQGILPTNDHILAIVGSRKANFYAKEVIEILVPQLIDHSWAIISGGALGADAMAHQATLNAQGITVAVLGSGLLQPYPKSNKKLFEQIIANSGALISSFPLNMQAMPGNFPARNRIIAGLSRGCVVVQAAEQSGASITAQFALDYGREVFAIPGPITDPLSAGCHRLIQQGATLVHNVQDIFQVFGEVVIQPHIIETKNIEQLTMQQQLLQACTVPSSIEELYDQTGMSLQELQSLLLQLQFDGLLQQDFTGRWIRR